jgi:hypothetical protein
VRIAALARSIVPRPRRRITVWTALPLALFVLAFGGACLFVDLAGVMLFTSPAAFLLSAVLPWIWWMHAAGASGLRGTRSVLALLVRLTLASLFIVLLAEPRAVRKDDTLAVVYALDVSDSIGESASNAALDYVTRTVAEKPEKDEAGLVVFGRDASVELPPRMAFPFEKAINSRILRDGTDLARGLSLAAAVLPEEHLGRIVLLSDGAQTEGALPDVLDELKARGIAVDVWPVHYDYKREVWIERLELPRFVRAGETYDASVVLSSLQEAHCACWRTGRRSTRAKSSSRRARTGSTCPSTCADRATTATWPSSKSPTARTAGKRTTGRSASCTCAAKARCS